MTAVSCRAVPDLLRVLKGYEGHIHVALDGGKVPDLPRLMASHGLIPRSLFIGDVDPEQERAGPWLLTLAPTDERLARTMILATRQDIGVFWLSRVGEQLMFRHLRSLNRIRIDTGEIVLFRHYDPLVFGSVAPVLDATQAERFFGPADYVAIAGAMPGSVLIFHPAGSS